jgi:acetylglutamate kinase
MVAPQLASVLAFVVTDAAINPSALQSVLQQAVDASFNNLTVDGDMSTNDCVMILANGLAENAVLDEDVEGFVEFSAAIQAICIELARSVAEDGEGATRLLEVRVDGAPDTRIARDIARAVAGSNLVKAAMFGSDPNWGRILATVGARAGLNSFPIDPLRATVSLQGISVFFNGAPAAFDSISLRSKLRLPEVAIAIRLAEGDAAATAWGCDLTYDYVKINADYASFTIASPEGTVTRDDRLTNYSPAFKRNLVVEALTYISKFSGKRAVIKWGGDLMNKQTLKMSFARDINLLDAVGLLPLVVHGGSREVAATLERFPPSRLSARPADSETASDDSMTAIRAADSDELKLFEMVLTGKINAELVSLLNHHAIARGEQEPKTKAVGVSGKDGGLLRALRTSSEGLAHAGIVDCVNPDLLELLMSRGYIAVVSPIGLAPDGDGYPLDSNAAAAEIAIAIKAEKLIFLTEQVGIEENGELVPVMSIEQFRERIPQEQDNPSFAALCKTVLRALDGGVHAVHIVDGRVPHNLVAELFTDRGVGTLIQREI